MLKPGGVFYLSTMEEDEHNKSRYQIAGAGDQVYVNYHQEGYLSKVLRENNFEIISLKRFSSLDTIIDLVWIGRLN
ncbi:hypothetical protein AY601_1863 [Pedobacter cryoconitis]|uniref:Uncharacterized protein n=1 Tax=Pedobacter cryoconitis TaxID=188932 RepID=A0A127VBJ8_9SPHI|nr:hypothetical protein [Pedobacter cryoconitis]AMP98772.1 hypothetical protein AY601_1863 [Pedobacter cryoconitis]